MTWQCELFAVAPPPRQRVAFVCLNPSTADERSDDPTLRRMMAFAMRLGANLGGPRTARIPPCGRYRYSLRRGDLEVVNLYAWRATKPRELERHDDATRIGPENDEAIRDAAQAADVVIAGWGSSLPVGGGDDRVRAVFNMLEQIRPVWCLGSSCNKRGRFPRHPLYLPGDTPLVRLEL